jgi:hypothetical protein
MHAGSDFRAHTDRAAQPQRGSCYVARCPRKATTFELAGVLLSASVESRVRALADCRDGNFCWFFGGGRGT